MALPCCSRPRGLEDKDIARSQIGVAQPLHPGFTGRAGDRNLDLAGLGPNEGSGGAFLKLRGELEARQAESLGKWAERPHPLSQTRQSGNFSPPPNGSFASPSPGPQPRSQSTSPPAHGQAEGWMGGLSNSMAGLGASLGVPLLSTPPSTPPAGILKKADAQLPSGGDSFNSEASKRSSGSGFSVSSRPSSLRGDITGRRLLLDPFVSSLLLLRLSSHCELRCDLWCQVLSRAIHPTVSQRQWLAAVSAGARPHLTND